MRIERREFLKIAAAAAIFPRFEPSAGWRIGLATADITPPAGVWMAGYAARTEASQGAAGRLHAKALAIEDGAGGRVVIVTLDLLGLTAAVVDRIGAAVRRRHGLRRENLLLCSSHTHSGPVVDDQLAVAYDLTAAQWDAVRSSTARIEKQIVALVGRALASRHPATLRTGRATASFAANRRTAFPGGPVDPVVPVLSVERPGGRLAAVVFGCACHNTTLPATFVRYHGDYAGAAQAEIERRYPGVTALFVAGCGADANPSPRGTLELAAQHGQSLADAVDAALGEVTEVRGRLRPAFATVALPYAAAPGAAEWRRRLDDPSAFVRRHAKLMLDRLASDGATLSTENAPVHVVRVGTLSLVAIGGEVVADYALAIRRRHGEATWVAGYTDSVFGYLPSARVLHEGGYEGGGAMLYYGRPGPFDETVESRVLAGVDDLMAATASTQG